MRTWMALAAAVWVTAACNNDKLTHVPPPGTRSDVFAQASASKIDLLWVIDNSGSMADKQNKLAASFQHFIDVFARGAIDYHIAITTTDVDNHTVGARGTFFSANGRPSIITSTDPDPLAEFQDNVKVGIHGSGNEEGLAGGKMALDAVNQANQPILQARTACEQTCSSTKPGDQGCLDTCDAQNEPDFLRPDAYLYVIAVSDEDDHSSGDALYYARSLETVKGLGNEVEVSFSAIAGDVPTPPCDATPAVRYANVAQFTGGIVGSVCPDDFSDDLTRLAEDAVGLKRHFLLSRLPQTKTLAVQASYRCDTPADELARCVSVANNCTGQAPSALGILCDSPKATEVPTDAAHPEGFTAGWSYQCSDNSIYFHRDATSDSVPGLRSQVQVNFLPADPKVAACSN